MLEVSIEYIRYFHLILSNTMLKKIILTTQSGDIENGFSILLDIIEEGTTSRRLRGNLPPFPNIKETVISWREHYHILINENSTRAIKVNKSEITNISYQGIGDKIKEEINQWLDYSSCSEWKKLQNQIRARLDEQDEVQFIIQTSDDILRQIPWQLWSLYADYNNLEFALSPLDYKNTQATKVNGNSVKILAIIGDSTNINIDTDKKLIEQLPDAQIKFLEEPDSEAIKNELWEEQYDILFFAGHSLSQNNAKTGQISINATESISIKTFTEALKHSVELGLKLAIFNSCDGLGLAEEITPIIPHVIVMRELVTNLAAQKFLEFFLKKFSAGESLFLSVSHARSRLQDLDKENETIFKFSSWLPTIFYNPTEKPLTWNSLKNNEESSMLNPVKSEEKSNFNLKIFIFPAIGFVAISSIALLLKLNNNQPMSSKPSKNIKINFTKESYEDSPMLNLTKYCKSNYGDDYKAKNEGGTIDGWNCVHKDIDTQKQPLSTKDFVKMCSEKNHLKRVGYFKQSDPYSLFCFASTDDSKPDNIMLSQKSYKYVPSLSLNSYCKNKYGLEFESINIGNTIYHWKCVSNIASNRKEYLLDQKDFFQICNEAGRNVKWVSYINEGDKDSLFCNKYKSDSL